jgi:hypothetical protein
MALTHAQLAFLIVASTIIALGLIGCFTYCCSPTGWCSACRLGPHPHIELIPLSQRAPGSGRVQPLPVQTGRFLEYDEATRHYIEHTIIPLPNMPKPAHIRPKNRTSYYIPKEPTITPPTPRDSLDSFRTFDSIFTGPIPSPDSYRTQRSSTPLPTLNSIDSFEAPIDDIPKSRFLDYGD